MLLTDFLRSGAGGGGTAFWEAGGANFVDGLYSLLFFTSAACSSVKKKKSQTLLEQLQRGSNAMDADI